MLHAENDMILRRFTSLPWLLDVLESKELLFSDPDNWEDENDSQILHSYREKKKLKTLQALCFTKDTETIYGWKAFADSSSGCYLKIDSDNINRKISNNDGFRQGEVKYIKMWDLKKETISINDIPFLKRWPYRDEKEYRYIFESDEEKGKVAIPIGLDDIISITFSEKMPEHTFSAIKGMIKFRYKISKIDRTTVYRNERWIEFIKGKSDA
jgi:hypothetical protein